MPSHSSQSVYIFILLLFYLFKPKSVVFLTVSYTNTLLILCVYFILFYVSLTELLNFFFGTYAEKIELLFLLSYLE